MTNYSPRILIVDDDLESIRMLGGLLSEHGYELTIARDGKKAIDIACEVVPDLILLDIVMPELNGFDTCKLLKNTPQTKTIPIIFLTAKVETADLIRAFGCGAVDYLTKPFISVELLARIDLHIRLIKQNQLLEQQAKDSRLSELRKSKFLADLSHEIRTPMNAILGFSELLTEQVSDPTEKEYLAAINSSGSSLLRLLDGVLDLSKIEAGKVSFKPNLLNLKQFSKELRMLFENQATSKGIELVTNLAPSLPEQVLLDETRVRQILSNLMSNAIKFTDSGSIVVNISSKKGSNSDQAVNLCFEVKDTGIGITPTEFKTIFLPFEQSSGQDSEKYKGTGLGLAISSQLALHMNGEISVTSTHDQGSSFFLLLTDVPITTEEISYMKTPIQESNILKIPTRKKVLVAEDVIVNQKLIEAFLVNQDLELIFVENGEEAVIKTQELKPDLILMDLKMPIMNGDEALKEIQKDQELAKIPVLILTASLITTKQLTDFIHYSEILNKPIQKSELLSKIQKLLK